MRQWLGRLSGTLACMAMAMTLRSAAAPAPASAGDEFIRGYATALIRDIFSVDRAVVIVRNGDVRVVCHFMQPADASSLAGAIQALPGVRSVRIEFDGRGASPPAHSGGDTPVASRTGWMFFPRRALFRPLLADSRWPRLGAYVRYYDDSNLYQSLAGVDLGAALPLLRRTAQSGRQSEMGFQAGVFSVFNPDAPEYMLMNSDYTVSLSLAHRRGPFSALGRFSHQSTHLGDEYIKHHPTNEIEKLSFQWADLLLSYDAGARARLYAGASYRMGGKPEDYDPWALRAGFEARSIRSFLRGTLRPLVAFDLLSQQENQWNADLTARAGIELHSVEAAGNRLLLLVEYFDGHMYDGQFYRDRTRYTGLAARLDFQ